MGDDVEARTAEPTRALAEFVSTRQVERAPQTIRDHIRLCVLDTIGCGLFGSTLPWTGLLARTVADVDDTRASRIWGTSMSLSVPNAALVNGSAAHAFEFDDLHARSIVHLGSVVVPAALATADLLGGVSGAEFVTAVIAGYEVGARVGAVVGASHLLAGWHPTGTHGTIAAAAACASLLRLDTDQTVNALGLAGTQAAGLMSAQYGAMAKRMHAGRAAHNGVYSALLASRGYTGAAAILETPYGGYWSTVASERQPEIATAGLGDDWETGKVVFKFYPANGSCHPTIEMLLKAKASMTITPTQVESVSVRCSTATAEHVGWAYKPDSVTTAQMNLSYIAAAALTDGELSVRQFAEPRLVDPELLALASRVRIVADPAIDAKGGVYRHFTEIDVALTDGRHIHDSLLAASRTSEAELRDRVQTKYRSLAAEVLPPRAVDRLADLVESVEHLDDARRLTKAMSLQP